ncbi:MAG: rhodanese-like domain-containing protein [Gammaproteobacteria bacterium]|nr:rhodanese-like domain-containing protein [Gammaproteobacteria bacterium]
MPFFHHSIPVRWLALLCLLPADLAAAEEGFDGRRLFPSVTWISLDELHARLDSVELVDVRSNYEYETLHIADAQNFPLGERDFGNQVRALRAASHKPIVFYCNGRSCMKSYEAVLTAQKEGVQDVLSYDAGVFDWVKRFPAQSVMLGESPVDPARLIDKERFAAHSLTPAAFEQRIGAGAIVLDIRDQYQQEGTTLFPAVQTSVPLDNKALKRYVEQAKRENKTLLIYDAGGQQVRWLQYYLEAEHVPAYFFMQGGAKGYYDSMIADLVGSKH